MPAVRQLAKQLGVTLEVDHGHRPGWSAITAEDVEGAASGGDGATRRRPRRRPRPTPGEERMSAPRPAAARSPSHMRHAIATAAHFTFVAECDMTADGRVTASGSRARARARRRQAHATSPYVVKALSRVAQALPDAQREPRRRARRDRHQARPPHRRRDRDARRAHGAGDPRRRSPHAVRPRARDRAPRRGGAGAEAQARASSRAARSP